MADKAEVLPKGHPVHLQDGAWGIKTEAELSPGSKVECKSKAGKTWTATLGAQVAHDDWGYTYARADDRKPQTPAPAQAGTGESGVGVGDDDSPY